MDSYTCPVCGFSGLSEPAYDLEFHLPIFDICPCCGCEFGYEDATPQAKDNFLKNWVKRGAPWFHPELKPPGWDLSEQLRSIGVDYDKLEGK